MVRLKFEIMIFLGLGLTVLFGVVNYQVSREIGALTAQGASSDPVTAGKPRAGAGEPAVPELKNGLLYVNPPLPKPEKAAEQIRPAAQNPRERPEPGQIYEIPLDGVVFDI